MEDNSQFKSHNNFIKRDDKKFLHGGLRLKGALKNSTDQKTFNFSYYSCS